MRIKEFIDREAARRCNEKHGTKIVHPEGDTPGVLAPEDWGFFLDEWEEIACELLKAAGFRR